MLHDLQAAVPDSGVGHHLGARRPVQGMAATMHALDWTYYASEWCRDDACETKGTAHPRSRERRRRRHNRGLPSDPTSRPTRECPRARRHLPCPPRGRAPTGTERRTAEDPVVHGPPRMAPFRRLPQPPVPRHNHDALYGSHLAGRPLLEPFPRDARLLRSSSPALMTSVTSAPTASARSRSSWTWSGATVTSRHTAATTTRSGAASCAGRLGLDSRTTSVGTARTSCGGRVLVRGRGSMR
jgi:hypothetical protein